MLRDGYEPGMGLGRNGDGTISLVRFVENRGRFGLVTSLHMPTREGSPWRGRKEV